jgi:hypothetical protein
MGGGRPPVKKGMRYKISDANGFAEKGFWPGI